MLSTYYYSQLNYAEQAAYNAIRTALLNRQRDCTIQISDPDSVRRVWKSVVMENPEIIHYHALYTFPTLSGGSATFRFGTVVARCSGIGAVSHVIVLHSLCGTVAL